MSIDHGPRNQKVRQDPTVPELKAKLAGETAIPPKGERDDRHKKRLGHLGVGGLVAAVVTTGLFVGSKVIGGESENTEPKVEPTVSAPVDPSENENSVASEVQPLSAEIYTTPEAVVDGYVSTVNQWMMSGATQETYDNESTTVSREQYLRQVAGPLDTTYADTLYIGEKTPNIISSINGYNEAHLRVLEANMITRGGDSLDLMPYELELQTTSVDILSSDDSTITARVRYSWVDNADKNRIGEVEVESSNGITGGEIITFTLVDGNYKIKDWEYFAG